ncbi:carboxypeptidase-like regulatory domain-containing protein [Hymenobacter weizhouensis]|uniref:carboxypeptidase-like regulatory domain-containing protein n=1 Tax=Hymenobacter sp. YIM 151500-1 TaxID=2987689 RepID=UPI0022262E13|nr:carboxypeptidase-like regulatory domain-containing protein [Hymenobacter sp. YIM 151500-1]UYZ62031.1 carboxypeptidase-like regulatory domain-containing protein [Hymenobacter sp. YIM 151500-1]
MHYLYSLILALLLPAQLIATLPDAPAAPPTRRPQQEPGKDSCPTVTGRILDQNGQPLVGATVLVKGTLNVHTTNSEGQYVMRGPVTTGATLAVSAAGYSALDIPLTTCQISDISLTLLPGTRLRNNGRIKRTTATGKIKY